MDINTRILCVYCEMMDSIDKYCRMYGNKYLTDKYIATKISGLLGDYELESSGKRYILDNYSLRDIDFYDFIWEKSCKEKGYYYEPTI